MAMHEATDRPRRHSSPSLRGLGGVIRYVRPNLCYHGTFLTHSLEQGVCMVSRFDIISIGSVSPDRHVGESEEAR